MSVATPRARLITGRLPCALEGAGEVDGNAVGRDGDQDEDHTGSIRSGNLGFGQ